MTGDWLAIAYHLVETGQLQPIRHDVDDALQADILEVRMSALLQCALRHRLATCCPRCGGLRIASGDPFVSYCCDCLPPELPDPSVTVTFAR